MGNQNGRPKIKILRASLKPNEDESSPRKGKKDKEKEKDKERENIEKDKEKKDKRKLDAVVAECDKYDNEEEGSDEQDELGDEQEFIPSNTVENDILNHIIIFSGVS
jgi:hypothetical protein